MGKRGFKGGGQPDVRVGGVQILSWVCHSMGYFICSDGGYQVQWNRRRYCVGMCFKLPTGYVGIFAGAERSLLSNGQTTVFLVRLEG